LEGSAPTYNLAIGLVIYGSMRRPQLCSALGVGALSYGASIVLYITAAQNIGATLADIFASSPFLA